LKNSERLESEGHMSVVESKVSLPSELRPVLAASNIQKTLGGQKILHGIDLTVHAHEAVAIIGPSGAGKSTFLRCLNLLERPEEGQVVLCGEELTRAGKRDLPRLRAGLGMVFQSFHLFPHLTAEQNIMLAPLRVLGLHKAEAKERAQSLLLQVGLPDKADSFPRELSGGQQQRIAIARALAMKPAAMLFDEPTSALDAETVHEVIRVMQDLTAQGTTMIVVSHELAFVRQACTRLLFMDQGRIIADSSPADFFANPPNGRARDFMSKILH
jgi:ABC-type polar amino acid transport system ATPase subunit